MAPLYELFTSHAVVKILDFLTLYKDFEYTKTDVAKETGISRRTLYEVFPILEQFGLVKITKCIGQVKLYQLDTNNPIAQRLIALADQIALYKAENETGIKLTSSIQLNEPINQNSSVKVSMLQIEANSAEQIRDIVREIHLEDGKIVERTKDSTIPNTITVDVRKIFLNE